MSSLRIRAVLPWLVALVAAELVIRFLGRTSIDGEFWVRSALLRPYQLPVVSLPQNLQRFSTAGSNRVIYDPVLGWAPRGASKAEEGKYIYESHAIRSEREINLTPGSGVIRIAVFGDSYTHGDDVANGETWGAALERELSARGVKNEVLNFGVSAYGIDQALLRWENFGQQFRPAVVILGFQAENMKRNLNLLRYFYSHGEDELPFTKPRFVLEGGALSLLNSPTVFPDHLPEVVAAFPTWQFSRYEHFYRAEDYKTNVLYKSKLFGFLLSFALTSNKYVYESQEQEFYSPDGEAGVLTFALLDRFRKSVEAQGAKFFVAHIPRFRHLANKRSGKNYPYAATLQRINAHYNFLDPEQELLAGAKEDLQKLYIGAFHFTPMGNEIFGKYVARNIGD